MILDTRNNGISEGTNVKKTLLTLLILTAIAFVTPGSNLQDHRVAKALQMQEERVAQDPSAEGYNDLGSLLQLMDRPDEAAGAFRQAIEWDGSNTTARLNLARLLSAEGESRDALKVLDEIFEIEPEHAWAHFTVGSIQENRGRRRSAIRAYATAFRIDPRLSFAEVNPQVVDSRLMTESLLRAFDDDKAPSKGVDPFFQNSAELEILLAADAEESLPDVETDREEGESSEEEMESVARPVFQSKHDTQPSAENGSSRIIGPDQLEESKVGQATPAAGSSRSGSTRGRSSKKAPSLRDHLKTKYGTRQSTKGGEKKNDGSRNGGTALGATSGQQKSDEKNNAGSEQPKGFRRGTYRPSRFSTGALDLELVGGETNPRSDA